MKHFFLLIAFLSFTYAATAQASGKPDGSWTLTKLSMGGSLKAYKMFSKVKLNFGDSGENVSGQSTCNNYNGPCVLDKTAPGSFDASEIMSTKKFCKNGMSTESAYLQVLEEADSYSLKGKSLTLYKDKKVVAVFKNHNSANI